MEKWLKKREDFSHKLLREQEVFTAIGHTLSTVLTSMKYVGCFQGNVYQDPSHLYNSTKKCLHINHFDSFIPCQMWKKVNELILCSITLV